MLKEFFVLELKRLDTAGSAIFQEDGAPPYFSRDVLQYFDKVLPNRWIRRDDSVRLGTTCFSDLSPLDFFLCGSVKNNIYKSSVGNLDERKIKIVDEIKDISRRTLSDVFSNLVRKIHLCISVEGEHFEQLLRLDLHCNITSINSQRNYEKLIDLF